MDQVWLALASGLLGAAAAIAGGVILSIVTARATRRQWLRDRLAGQCEEFVAALRAADISLLPGKNSVYRREDLPDEAEFVRRWSALDDAAVKLDIYGSKDVVLYATDVAYTYETVYRDLCEGRQQDALAAWAKVRLRAQSAIRDELGAAPVMSRKSRRKLGV